MKNRTLRLLLPAVAGLLLVAGCTDLAGLPTNPGGGGTPIGGGSAGDRPTVAGTVQVDPAPANLRVGLLGSLAAGGAKKELVSSAVTGGAYSLRLSKPHPSLMVQPAEEQSIVFFLTAYEDKNNNKTYDSGDVETEAETATGTFRYFENDGPAGSYRSGWNLYKDGLYVQTFNTAFNIQE